MAVRHLGGGSSEPEEPEEDIGPDKDVSLSSEEIVLIVCAIALFLAILGNMIFWHSDGFALLSMALAFVLALWSGADYYIKKTRVFLAVAIAGVLLIPFGWMNHVEVYKIEQDEQQAAAERTAAFARRTLHGKSDEKAGAGTGSVNSSSDSDSSNNSSTGVNKGSGKTRNVRGKKDNGLNANNTNAEANRKKGSRKASRRAHRREAKTDAYGLAQLPRNFKLVPAKTMPAGANANKPLHMTRGGSLTSEMQHWLFFAANVAAHAYK